MGSGGILSLTFVVCVREGQRSSNSSVGCILTKTRRRLMTPWSDPSVRPSICTASFARHVSGESTRNSCCICCFDLCIRDQRSAHQQGDERTASPYVSVGHTGNFQSCGCKLQPQRYALLGPQLSCPIAAFRATRVMIGSNLYGVKNPAQSFDAIPFVVCVFLLRLKIICLNSCYNTFQKYIAPATGGSLCI